MQKTCDECGRTTADCAPGEPGSAHAQFWYCSACWQAWGVAHCGAPVDTAAGVASQVDANVMRETVSYQAAESILDTEALKAVAHDLVSISDVQARNDAVQTIFKLIDAIIATPEDSKKRRVKRANEAFHRKAGRHKAAVAFLHAIGFEDVDEPEAHDSETGHSALLVMPTAYVMVLINAHETLARLANAAGLATPELPNHFNPFQEAIQAVGLAASTKKEVVKSYTKEEKEARKLLREKVDIGPPVDMQPVAFWLAAGKKLQDVIREISREEGDAVGQATDNMIPLKQGQCVLRVVCPDKSVLQVRFRAGDSGDHVMNQLGPLLAPHVRRASWYIYTTPPLKRLNPSETLAAAGLAPGASMYLGFDGEKPESPFLEASLVSQLGDSPVQGGVSPGSTNSPGRSVEDHMSGKPKPTSEE